MAAGDAGLPYPVYGAAYRITFPIFDNDGDLVPDAAGLDTEISKDGGAFTDATNEATQIGSSSGLYYLDLTYEEMQCSTLAGKVKSTTADSKDTPFVLYPRRLPVLETGTAQAGAAGTITLASGASSDDDEYNACIVHITSGTGVGQARVISDYVGSTRVASVSPNWGTQPDNTSVYQILRTDMAGTTIEVSDDALTEIANATNERRLKIQSALPTPY